MRRNVSNLPIELFSSGLALNNRINSLQVTGISHNGDVEVPSSFVVDTMMTHTKVVLHITTTLVCCPEPGIKLAEDIGEWLTTDICENV